MVRSQPGPAWVVPVLFAALGVLWGIPYLLIKVAVAELEPAAMVLGRTATAAAVMVPLALWRGELVPVLRRWRPVVAFALVEITVPWLLLARAEVHLSSSLTGLLLAGVPVAGVVLGLVLRTSERLGAVALGGIALGLVGVALLVGVDVGVLGGGGREQFVAVAEVGLVAVLYAVGPVIMVRSMSDLPSVGVIAVALLVATTVVAVPGALAAPSSVPSAPVVLSVVAQALLCTVLAFLLLFALVARVGAVRATLITYLNPAVAVTAGVLVLGEPLTWATVAGFVLVLAGSALASRRRPVPPPDAAVVADAVPEASAGELRDR